MSGSGAARTDGDGLVTVDVLRLAPGGGAVGPQVGGAHPGRATFVALSAPGERVQARIVREKARVAFAELVQVTRASESRVAAPCPVFGRCGGCQWQHVALAEQRRQKVAIVARALGWTDAKVVLRQPSVDGQGYRDRLRASVGGQGQVGFRARGAHEIVDIPRCLLAAPALQQAWSTVRAWAARLPPGTDVELQLGREGVHVAIAGPGQREGHGEGWGEALGQGRGEAGAWPSPPQLSTLLAAWRPVGIVGVRITRQGPGGAATVDAGMPDVDVSEPDGPPLRIPAGAFAQVGAATNAVLVEEVLAGAGAAPGRVLELYAGSGNFTRHLVGRADGVVACELDASAMERGRANVPQARWLRRPPVPVEADVVVLDPPRAGLDELHLVAARAARARIVYVSCDSQTLGRDARALHEAGFRLASVVAVDTMPHTHHVEVVARLDRVGPAIDG